MKNMLKDGCMKLSGSLMSEMTSPRMLPSSGGGVPMKGKGDTSMAKKKPMKKPAKKAGKKK